MRLLNVHTLNLEEFTSERHNLPPEVEYLAPARSWGEDSDRPRQDYVILSHRWGDDEVSFKEWRKGLKTSGQGYEKIMQCCEFIKARPDWPQYVWIDTIAIDKRSSAELSEAGLIAINSMYKWYSQATVCVAYLSDVVGPWPDDQAEFWKRTLAVVPGSVWFTRGWTLQELIAPKRVLFCSAEWVVLGWKAPYKLSHQITMVGGQPSLNKLLSEITGIDEHVFAWPEIWREQQSVAQRMCWASRRQTTRPEDLAYSLLGLFSVNMPLLYGEGASKAFVRLQLEIIRKSTDESIFAWEPHPFLWAGGLLAHSPQVFNHAGNILSLCNEDPRQAHNLKDCGPLTDSRFMAGRPTYQMTNKGLEFRAPAWRLEAGGFPVYILWLACARRSSDKGEQKRIMYSQSGRLQHTSQCYVILNANPENRVNDRVQLTRRYHTNEPLFTEFPPETWQDVGAQWFEIIQDGR
ncbi:hypothetical protein LTR17_022116 [Elasticomyces elasticus]|nr:hypothetical protein LTR17_022116 [Elasticomyces elasticus]